MTASSRQWSVVSKNVCCFAPSAMLFALCSYAEAQQAKTVPRIGYLAPDSHAPTLQSFRQGLRDLGYVEGKNILVEPRYVEGKQERVPSLVAELVQLKVDVVVTGSLPAILAAKQATKAIPIVIVTAQDPVATGPRRSNRRIWSTTAISTRYPCIR